MKSIRSLVPAILLLASACGPPSSNTVIRGGTMGTTYTVQLSHCDTQCRRELEPALSQRLDELSNMLSHYEPESALSAFNRYADTDWFPVPAEFALVMQLSLAVSEASDGTFDVTVAPAVAAWGFGPEPLQQPPQVPSSQRLSRALEAGNYRSLAVRMTPPALRKNDPRITLNLSAVAKGFAADQLALMLEQRGHRNYLIEIGGDIRCAGTRPDGTPWRIGLERPDDALQVRYVIAPGDAGIASSGNYRNYYRLEDGTRISHTLDPATARPLDHDLEAVSVVAPDAAQADALATALMVMGPERGYTFAREGSLPALFFIRGDNGRSDELMTPEFRQILIDN